MIEVRQAGRTVLDRGLKVARFPFDAATHLLPGDGDSRSAAELAIDRADARVRAAVGVLFRDDDLRDDAARRRVAADERARAIELRMKAEARQRAADAKLVAELDEAERVREQAEREAQARLEQADAERARRQQRNREAAAKQKREVEAALAEELAAEEQQAKRERVEVLDEQAKALDEEADAITARDEAERLCNAASATKAKRKRAADGPAEDQG